MARKLQNDPLFDDEANGGLFARILPSLVLIFAFGGFIALAIYAYKAGSNNGSDGELRVIEADAAPVKEKPEDPGGMQFPNQDKTIFETFSSGENQPPKVERVLPTPEEPLPQNTSTLVTTNSAAVAEVLATDSTNSNSAVKAVEQVFSADKPDSQVTTSQDAASASPKIVNVQEELGKQAVAEIENSAILPKNTEVILNQPEAKPEPKKIISEKIEQPEKSVKSENKSENIDKKEVFSPPLRKSTKTAKQFVQLGSYKDEAAARADFIKMKKKNPELAGKSPIINRADLGEKGIFYRLRVAVDDAKLLCKKLSSSGQACIVVK